MTDRAPDETDEPVHAETDEPVHVQTDATADAKPDPRARWRSLPPEPVDWIEEKASSTAAAEQGIPNIDLTEDFVRKYGLGG